MDIIKCSLVSSVGWLGIYKFLEYLAKKKKTTPKVEIISNKISAIHASTTVALMGYNYFFRNYFGANNVAYIISGGYFLYDLINLLCFKKQKKILKTGYIIHHLISFNLLYVLQNNPVYHNYSFIYGLVELSNIPSYIVYNSIKKNKKKDKIKKEKFIQAIIYSTIRVPIMGYFGYLYTKDCLKEQSTNNKVLISSYWGLYSLGIFWSCKLWKNYYFDKKNI